MRGLERTGVWAAGFLIATVGALFAHEAKAIRYDNIDVVVSNKSGEISAGAYGLLNFKITNVTNGTINSIRFRAYLPPGGTFADGNPVAGSAVATCTVRNSGSMLDCSITENLGGYATSDFDFFFQTPSTATSVEVEWDVRFGQGDATNFISTGASATDDFVPTPVPLIGNSTSEARSYVPQTGAPLSTGSNFVPTNDDPFAVYVYADPAINKFVTAAIKEAVPEGGRTCYFAGTFTCAQLDVLNAVSGERAIYAANGDLESRLEIKLRVAAFLTKGKNISQATVWYTPDVPVGVPLPAPTQLDACPKRPADYAPQPDEPPCLAKRIEYTKRTAPDSTLIGVWEFTLYASKNGFIDLGL